MNSQEKSQKKPADVIVALLFGIGLAMGFVPIFIASLIVKRNLMLEVFDHMDGFWRSRGWS